MAERLVEALPKEETSIPYPECHKARPLDRGIQYV